MKTHVFTVRTQPVLPLSNIFPIAHRFGVCLGSFGILAELMESDVTLILKAVSNGDSEAPDKLLPAVYEELRKLASSKMAREPAGHTLQATVLVHESYLRLFGQSQPSWENRRHFFAAAAEAMRRILIEHARKKKSKKRGAGAQHVLLDDMDIQSPLPSDSILDVNDALEKLATVDDRCVQLVKMRYFAGFNMVDIADVLDCSPRTVDKLWKFTKAWLRKEIEGMDNLP